MPSERGANAVDTAVDFFKPEGAIMACSQAPGTMTYGAVAIAEEAGIAIYAASRLRPPVGGLLGKLWSTVNRLYDW